ncbi:SRPBCC family protein [Chryseobacterium oranimense]|uniref:SRPBCC family protein n=1 Tax=Chryseobacterium oranimense TaxID=421058 RepID=UPI0022358DB8|nr:SRPBCC domain-containing protein [Chryseobacterium oranimense]
MSKPITIQYKINAPLEKVWNALTDKNEMKSWYFDIRDFVLETGKEFNFYEPGEAKKYHHQCRILEIVPNRKLKHTWLYPEFSDAVTTVTWELQEEGSGTLVTLTHDNIESFDSLGENFSSKSFTEGWNGIIGQSMKNYLEK